MPFIATKIFQKSLTDITWASLSQIGDKTYFLIGTNLERFTNGQFQNITSFNINNFGYEDYGRNEKDIFLRMKDGLAHYNGSNIEYLYHFNSSNISISANALIFKGTVFFTADDNSNDCNIMLRGKLKE